MLMMMMYFRRSLASNWHQFASIWGWFWLQVGPFGAHVSPFWEHFGPSWPHLEEAHHKMGSRCPKNPKKPPKNQPKTAPKPPKWRPKWDMLASNLSILATCWTTWWKDCQWYQNFSTWTQYGPNLAPIWGQLGVKLGPSWHQFPSRWSVRRWTVQIAKTLKNLMFF